LPGLLDDAQRTARAEADGPQRRAALAVLAEVYALTQFFVSYQPAQDLVWRVAERGVSTALDSDDLHAVGVAAWLMTQAHREAGDWDAADVVASQATALLRDSLSSDDATDDVAALWGALQFESGYTAARRGEIGNAWRYWDAADAVARRLPDDYFHPVTSFSQTVMHAHAVTVAVELRQSGEGVRQAERWRAAVIPSHPRQARHWIEQARAYQIDRKYDEALRLLDHAYDSAPETIRYNGHARRIILEELDARDGRRREQASELARKVGLLGV
jgi:tetratricopeptide (TPR) repeat protein